MKGTMKRVYVCRGCGRPSISNDPLISPSTCPHCRRHIVWTNKFGGSRRWHGGFVMGSVPVGYLYVANEEAL